MEIIDRGEIRNQEDLKFYPYEIRLLGEENLPEIMDLQELVLGVMEKKDFCVPLTAQEHLDILQGQGEALGLFSGERLYAVCGILFPGLREDNMARELDFSADKLADVGQFEIAVVHPCFQGNDLQQKMAGLLAQRAKDKKKCRYLFTTVSPYNYPSIKTVTSLGLFIAKVCKKYFAWDRYVVYRDLVEPIELDTTEAICVVNMSLDKQQELLKRGYLGFTQVKDGDDIKIFFAKRKQTNKNEIGGLAK